MIFLVRKVVCCLKKIVMVESLLFIAAGAGAGEKKDPESIINGPAPPYCWYQCCGAGTGSKWSCSTTLAGTDQCWGAGSWMTGSGIFFSLSPTTAEVPGKKYAFNQCCGVGGAEIT